MKPHRKKRIRVSTLHYEGLERRSGLKDRRLDDRRKRHAIKERRTQKARPLIEKDIGRTISQQQWAEIQILKRNTKGTKIPIEGKSSVKRCITFLNGKFFVTRKLKSGGEKNVPMKRRSIPSKQFQRLQLLKEFNEGDKIPIWDAPSGAKGSILFSRGKFFVYSTRRISSERRSGIPDRRSSKGKQIDTVQ